MIVGALGLAEVAIGMLEASIPIAPPSHALEMVIHDRQSISSCLDRSRAGYYHPGDHSA
jgi:hypothetical protein